MASTIGRNVTRAVILLSVVVAAGAAARQVNRPAHPSLVVFDRRVAEYVALHRRLEAQLPPLETSTDPERFIAHRNKLAASIKNARPMAGEGHFFDASVAPVFRMLIDEALYGLDVEGLLTDLFEEHPRTWRYKVKVYDTYPSWATREMPGMLLQELPVLPEELEYRFVDHDLAILDADANLVLDVLRDAVARRQRSEY